MKKAHENKKKPMNIIEVEKIKIDLDAAYAELHRFDESKELRVRLRDLEEWISEEEAFISEGIASVGGQGLFDDSGSRQKIDLWSKEAEPLRDLCKTITDKITVLKNELEMEKSLSEWQDLESEVSTQQPLSPPPDSANLNKNASPNIMDRIKAFLFSDETKRASKSPESDKETSNIPQKR